MKWLGIGYGEVLVIGFIALLLWAVMYNAFGVKHWESRWIALELGTSDCERACVCQPEPERMKRTLASESAPKAVAACSRTQEPDEPELEERAICRNTSDGGDKSPQSKVRIRLLKGYSYSAPCLEFRL